MNRPKAPREPRQPLIFHTDDFATVDTPLFRVHHAAGPYPTAWNQFRRYGPLDSSRWDPHPRTRGEHPGYGVLYASTSYVTALAETAQRTGRINITARLPALAGWQPTRPLHLLDLGSNWPIRNGASRALQSAPKSTCRAWARAIKNQGPRDLDGLRAEGTLTQASQVIVLWEPERCHFPTAPDVWRALNDPAISPLVAEAARETGFGITSR